MPEINIDVKFEVYCKVCGYGLCFDTEVTTTRSRGEHALIINPCPVCLKEKQDEIDYLEKEIEKLKD